MSKVIQFLDALKKELPNMFDVKDGAPMAEFWESFDAAYQEAAANAKTTKYKLLMEWLRANNSERFRATTSYEQNTLRDFAIWLDEQAATGYVESCAHPKFVYIAGRRHCQYCGKRLDQPPTSGKGE